MNTTIINTQGVQATNFTDTLKAASLDWEPLSDGVSGTDTAIVMPRRKLLYRSDDHQALGIVGKEYAPSNPREFLQTQYEFAEFIKGEVIRAGFIPDRSRAFAFIRLKEDLKLPREIRAKGDPTSVYIYSTDGWDGGTPRRSRLYLERLVCANGMTSKEIKPDLWVSHTKGSAERYDKQWKTFLAEVCTNVETIRNQFITLAQARMSEADAKAFLEKLMPGESTITSKRREVVLNLFKTGVGNEGTSRWDAFNAVTEYVTHHRSYRGEEGAETTNRFLGVLETDTLRNQAMALLALN